MNKIKLLGLILILIVSLFYNLAKAAPMLRGRVYEITAKIISIKEESKQWYVDEVCIPAEIELVKIGRMLKENQDQKPSYRDKYESGQKLEVKAFIKASDLSNKKVIFKANSLVKGSIYAHGDERGMWYIFKVIENVSK